MEADRDDRSGPAIILVLGKHQSLTNPDSFELPSICLSPSLSRVEFPAANILPYNPQAVFSAALSHVWGVVQHNFLFAYSWERVILELSKG